MLIVESCKIGSPFGNPQTVFYFNLFIVIVAPYAFVIETLVFE